MASFATETFNGIVKLVIRPANRPETPEAALVQALNDFLDFQRVQSGSQTILSRRLVLAPFNESLHCAPTIEFWEALLGGSFPDLEELTVDHQQMYTPHQAMLSNQPRLNAQHLKGLGNVTSLTLMQCPEINDSVLKAMAPFMRKIKVLILWVLPGVTYRGKFTLQSNSRIRWTCPTAYNFPHANIAQYQDTASSS